MAKAPAGGEDSSRREPASAPPAVFARLYGGSGAPPALGVDDLAGLALGDDQMLWVDVQGDDEALFEQVREALSLPRPEFPGKSQPALMDLGECFAVRVVAVHPANGHGFDGDVLDLHGARNRLVTRHRTALPFLDAGSGYEAAVERLELEIFDDRHLGSLPELRTLRRGASRLRRMLSPHRAVYGLLSRPDFRPGEGRDAARHFGALDGRFERAMDMVENCRDLVMGSFDLFSNQTALRTNASMSVLTFATVVLGILAVVAGMLGMNFKAGFFDATSGFWYATGALVMIGLAALLLGRWRKWF